MAETGIAARATFWRAWMETRAFAFEAFAPTRSEAKQALVDGLRIHAEQYSLPPDWWRGYAQAECEPIVLGLCYRDREPLRARSDGELIRERGYDD